MSVDFTTRVNCGKPFDTTSINNAMDNSEDLLTRKTFSGCRAKKSGPTITTSVVAIDFDDSEEYDTDAWHSTVTNPSRFTVPAGLGIKYVTMTLFVEFGDSNVNVITRKNGSNYHGRIYNLVEGERKASFRSFSEATAGDYFEVYAATVAGSIAGNFQFSIRGHK